MNESLFKAYVARFFPKLQRLIEKVNENRSTTLTYLHKTMLRTEYSSDNKWESTTVNTTYVAADIIAVDSPIPIKSRGTLASANGKLPKIGMSKILKESDINALNVIEAQGGNQTIIANKLANDTVSCAVGIDERDEFNYLYALSHGYVAIKDDDNPDTMLRLNFNYIQDHTFGATVKDNVSLADIKKVIAKADADGNSIIQICISKTTYDKLRQTDEAKLLVANYNGQVITSTSILPVPTATKFNEAFADDNGGITFRVIDRAVLTEENGKKKSVKPWDNNRLIFICNEVVGTLVYGRLAEQTNPVSNVTYNLVDTFKLISKYSLTNPLREITSGQAFVAPIIEDVDQIYILDISVAQEVDTTAESADTTDIYVTVFGNKYTKSSFIAAMKSVGVSIKANASDDTIIKAVNALNEDDKSKLKVLAASAIVSSKQ